MTDDELTLYASGWLQPVVDGLMERPIAPQRWRALHDTIDHALSERAAILGVSKQQALRIMARASSLLTFNGLAVPARLFDPDEPKAPHAREYVLERVRSDVNNLVTEDLLGPDWRHPVGLPADFEPISEYSLQDKLEIESEFRRVLAELQDDEQGLEIILGRYLEESWAETAQRLDKSEPAIRQAWVRLKRRISEKLKM